MIRIPNQSRYRPEFYYNKNGLQPFTTNRQRQTISGKYTIANGGEVAIIHRTRSNKIKA